jgi:hypothetical protein
MSLHGAASRPRTLHARPQRLCCTSRLRIESTRTCGTNETSVPQRHRLGPTDSSASGSCIAWALIFDVCPRPDAVEGALNSLLHSHPQFAARPRPAPETRWELQGVPGTGVPLELASWEDESVPSVHTLLSTALGFREAELSARAARNVPFLVLPDTKAMDKGDAPLLALRLTRLACGGGVLAATFSHQLADGQRCLNLLKQLSAACRGEALPASSDDGRARLWPDAFRALPGVEAALSTPPPPPPPPPTLQHDETCTVPPASPPPVAWSLLPLHIPAAALDKLVADVRAISPPGIRPSAHDASAGLLWALRCALAGTALPGERCSGRFIVALDLICNGLPPDTLPPSFDGNAAAALCVEPPSPMEPPPLGDSRELECVAAAAAAIRCAIQEYRSDPRNAIDHILSVAARESKHNTAVGGAGAWRTSSSGSTAPLVGYATSCLRTSMEVLDCGTGPPCAIHYSTLPLRSSGGLLFGSIAPGPRGDGALLLIAASVAHAEKLVNGVGEAGALLRTAPGARFLI